MTVFSKSLPGNAPALRRKKGFFYDLKRQGSLQLMVLPSVILIILFSYLPLYGIIIAFKRFDVFDGVLGSAWASNYGFEHFIDFFKDPNWVNVVRNTLIIAGLKLGLLSFAPVILAIMLNEIKAVAFKKVNQTISYLPHFISWMVIGGLAGIFLNSRDGLLNEWLLRLNLIDSSTDFLSQTKYYWGLIILMHGWKEVGYGSIIYLAVISGIDPTLYEAVDIDGGGRWAKIRYITWPHLLETFMIMFILACGSIMSGAGDALDQAKVFGNAANRSVSDVLDYYVLRIGLEQARYSYATAVGLMKSVINLALLLLANTLSRRVTEKSLF